MGYFRRSAIQRGIDYALQSESFEEYTAGDVEAAWLEMDRCLQKVDDDEPIFVLRAQDVLSVPTISYWLSRAISLTPEHRAEANQHIERIKLWQQENLHRVKAPD